MFFDQFTTKIVDIFKGINIKFIAVNKNGLVKGAEKVFRGKKVTQDYHEEMNGPHFEEHLR